jgi:hypothetical protein
MRERIKNIILVSFAGITAFCVGYMIGSAVTAGSITKVIISEGFKYLDYKNVTINMDKTELINYFYKYFLKGG